ncbi:hypothetical protein JIY74_35445, partial [Vibrio harveyi]|nr:hypothetical protein [Vibrio harveyi]
KEDLGNFAIFKKIVSLTFLYLFNNSKTTFVFSLLAAFFPTRCGAFLDIHSPIYNIQVLFSSSLTLSSLWFF